MACHIAGGINLEGSLNLDTKKGEPGGIQSSWMPTCGIALSQNQNIGITRCPDLHAHQRFNQSRLLRSCP